MSILEFSLIVAAGSLVAGFLGALTGLGGGVVIVPMLSLLLGVDIRYAIGASLVSVIATSSGAAAAYVREGISRSRRLWVRLRAQLWPRTFPPAQSLLSLDWC